jgi:hypothetical protein
LTWTPSTRRSSSATKRQGRSRIPTHVRSCDKMACPSGAA